VTLIGGAGVVFDANGRDGDFVARGQNIGVFALALEVGIRRVVPQGFPEMTGFLGEGEDAVAGADRDDDFFNLSWHGGFLLLGDGFLVEVDPAHGAVAGVDLVDADEALLDACDALVEADEALLAAAEALMAAAVALPRIPST
jgi:hypothetical protein